MMSPPVRRALVGVTTLLCTSTATLALAEDAAPAEPAAAAEGAPASPALAGAANLTAAVRAERLTKGASELREQASKETEAQKLETEKRASQMEAAARQAKLEAFNPAEFARTSDAATKIAAEAELRRTAARKLAAEADARHEEAKAAVEKAAAEDRAEADALVTKRKAASEAATTSATKADAAAEHASLAAQSAKEAVEAADVALALTSAFTTAMERATTEAGAARDATLASAIEMKQTIDEKKVVAFDQWMTARKELDEYQQLLPALDAAKQSAQPPAPASDSETLANGTRLSWGITGSLLRFQTQRSENLPGRVRNFRPRYEFVPGEVGFQFLVEPVGSPWRLQLENGKHLQLMSWGGLLLASLGEDKALERGSLSLGATLTFFENAIGLGAGFDLYRGIPVRGADGTPGGDTAFTGALAWAFAQEGEVTAENAFVVVTVNLSSLIGALTGKEDSDHAN